MVLRYAVRVHPAVCTIQIAPSDTPPVIRRPNDGAESAALTPQPSTRQPERSRWQSTPCGNYIAAITPRPCTAATHRSQCTAVGNSSFFESVRDGVGFNVARNKTRQQGPDEAFGHA
jgi:hypothetical protein